MKMTTRTTMETERTMRRSSEVCLAMLGESDSASGVWQLVQLGASERATHSQIYLCISVVCMYTIDPR